jgi:hypothetical protein
VWPDHRIADRGNRDHRIRRQRVQAHHAMNAGMSVLVGFAVIVILWLMVKVVVQ